MMDFRPFEGSLSGLQPQRYDADVEALVAGVRLYQVLCVRARIHRFVDRLLGRKVRSLLDLTTVRAQGRLYGSHDAGIQTVSLQQIVGSVGRAADFDAQFLPTRECTRDRWAGIYAARLADVTMPAIQLVRVGDCYFVLDGHHRVSVARQLREEYIDAHVTVWDMKLDVAGTAVREPLVAVG